MYRTPFVLEYSPYLSAHDIPISDDLIDILGFLAHEIVFDHIEQGKHAARRRITTMRRLEMRAKKEVLRAALAASSTKGKKKIGQSKKSITSTGEAAVAKEGQPVKGQAKKRAGLKKKKTKKKSDAQATQEEEQRKLAELRAEEQNRHPDGPFTAPAGSTFTHGMPVSMHCTTDFDDGEMDERLDNADDPAVEHSKVDNSTTHASIVSAYDVLLGDFEQGYHASKREGWDRVPPMNRKRRFVTLFR